VRPDGAIDLADLDAKLAAHDGQVAAIMLTYPSTNGVYEETSARSARQVHAAGGQVYIDGANLNALVGLATRAFGGRRVAPEPAQDVLHPARRRRPRRRPGRRPRAPGPVPARHPGWTGAGGQVAAAPYGSAGILPISWAYIAMMGAEGLRRATQVAVLSANYVAKRLAPHFPVLYTGRNGLVAHECIIDLRPLPDRDHRRGRGQAADRLRLPRAHHVVPGGGHAHDRADREREPRRARPVLRRDDRDQGGDRSRVASGEYDAQDNPLKNAPHTAEMLIAGTGSTPTSRRRRPTRRGDRRGKYWPPVRRIDQAYGDRNLVCACPPPEAFPAGHT
jgi:glycine dehydrogenase